MSRSEHATRRDHRDPGDLDRKHRIKALIAVERERPRVDLPPVPADALPIEVHDRGRFIQYPASADDLRGVMARLPAGSVNGLGAIDLRLIKPGDGVPPDDHRPVDPFVGRIRNEIVPGVFVGPILGRYNPDGARIQLFAYVYDPTVPGRAIVETYLRLKMLATFVHELGHHQDSSTRVARGRWRADDAEECEFHAEAIEHAWTHDYVVPYLEETYPAATDELRRWLELHGGITLPLEMLVGDPRTTRGVGGVRLFFGVDSAFEELLAAVARGETPPATQIGLATDLHYGLNYEEALAILAHVLDRHPDHAGALVMRADIFVHQERLDEADAIARVLVARDPDDADAWQVLLDIAQGRGDWPGVLDAAARLHNLHAADSWQARSNLEPRARARIELSDWDGAERDIAELRANATSHLRRRVVHALSCLLLLRQQRYAEALQLATEALAEGRPGMDLLAVQLEAACQLGRPYDADTLPELCADLRRCGYAAWAERLAALVTLKGQGSNRDGPVTSRA